MEKVRVNPGNYVDKKKFEIIDYTDQAYEKELERIRMRFTPLVKICKEYGTAMRIGTNHGSLSDRILSRYGDTPLGMVESAMEFLRICEDNNFHNIVLSMKASNPQVMVQAYRLLVKRMDENGMNYPLHLGVTEAGEGEDGRIKSAVGIGSLLEDGIGDTIRVSLTEEPELEIPVAKALVERYNNRLNQQQIAPIDFSQSLPYNPYDYKRRESVEVVNIGAHHVPRLVADFSEKQAITPASFFGVGYNYSVPLDKWNITDRACDYVYVGDNSINFEIPGTLGLIYNNKVWKNLKNKTRSYPLFTILEFNSASQKSKELNFVIVNSDCIGVCHSERDSEYFLAQMLNQVQQNNTPVVFVIETDNIHGMAEQRRMFIELMQHKINVPVIIKRNYFNLNEEAFQLQSATDFGALLLDGFGDGLWIKQTNCSTVKNTNATAFGILQATRTRISKTEYISCPSCGRTLFDLQETTQKIRHRTDHLKGLKIGIMGCIVNGPGEMADADYGYVGTGVGKITLYKGREVMERNINAENAVDALVDLIKKNGDWIDKETINN